MQQLIDFTRLGRMAVIGTCINGPMLATWYKFLDSRFTGVATKLVLDQGLFAPTIISSKSFSIQPLFTNSVFHYKRCHSRTITPTNRI
jgi:hypothetical protein